MSAGGRAGGARWWGVERPGVVPKPALPRRVEQTASVAARWATNTVKRLRSPPFAGRTPQQTLRTAHPREPAPAAAGHQVERPRAAERAKAAAAAPAAAQQQQLLAPPQVVRGVGAVGGCRGLIHIGSAAGRSASHSEVHGTGGRSTTPFPANAGGLAGGGPAARARTFEGEGDLLLSGGVGAGGEVHGALGACRCGKGEVAHAKGRLWGRDPDRRGARVAREWCVPSRPRLGAAESRAGRQETKTLRRERQTSTHRWRAAPS